MASRHEGKGSAPDGHVQREDGKRSGGGGGGDGYRDMQREQVSIPTKVERGGTENNMACNVIAGLAAGVSGTLLGHPLDTLKTYMQVGSGPNPSSVAGKSMSRANSATTKTVFSLLHRLFREGNIVHRLYVGVGPPLVSSVMLNAVCFAVYNKNVELLKPLITGENNESLCRTSLAPAIAPQLQSPTSQSQPQSSQSSFCCSMIPFIAGWNVGFVSSIISTPFEGESLIDNS